jgi:hypothetical protein
MDREAWLLDNAKKLQRSRRGTMWGSTVLSDESGKINFGFKGGSQRSRRGTMWGLTVLSDESGKGNFGFKGGS